MHLMRPVRILEEQVEQEVTEAAAEEAVAVPVALVIPFTLWVSLLPLTIK